MFLSPKTPVTLVVAMHCFKTNCKMWAFIPVVLCIISQILKGKIGAGLKVANRPALTRSKGWSSWLI